MISQVYPPDAAAVGQYMHDVAAEMVRRGRRVVVYCANRDYDDPSKRYPSREVRDGVEIRRLPLSSFGKRSIAVRLLAHMLFVVQVAVRGLGIRHLKGILVSTSPPMAGAAALVIRFFRRAPITFWAMDLSVDQMIATGRARATAITTRMLRSVYSGAIHEARDVIALDRFMAKRIEASYGAVENVHVLPPWPLDVGLEPIAHDENPFRRRHALEGKFVFMYSGNMGLSHPIDVLLEAARTLEDDPRIVFMFIGGGVRRGEIAEAIRTRNPHNLRLLPYQPLADLRFSLSAADIHLATMEDEGVGCFHPCKVYGAMAVGRPILFAGPEPSHVTDLIERYEMGWRISTHDPAAAADQMRRIAELPRDQLEAMGERARTAVCQELSRAVLCERFCSIALGEPPGSANPLLPDAIAALESNAVRR